MSDEEVEEFNFKVLIVGEVGVGKTSIIERYTQDHFSTLYKPTLGADFALKVVPWNSKTKIHLQLWDVAGQERYSQMTRVYYKYAMAAFIVYDLSRPDTFDAVTKWYHDLTENVVTEDEQSIPIILLGNKCDLDGIGYDESFLNAFCEDHGFEAWFPVSAKADKNVDDAMSLIISVILSKQPQKDKLRPGTPWYNARSPTPKSGLMISPTPKSGLIISPSDNKKINERKDTCC